VDSEPTTEGGWTLPEQSPAMRVCVRGCAGREATAMPTSVDRPAAGPGAMPAASVAAKETRNPALLSVTTSVHPSCGPALEEGRCTSAPMRAAPCSAPPRFSRRGDPRSPRAQAASGASAPRTSARLAPFKATTPHLKPATSLRHARPEPPGAPTPVRFSTARALAGRLGLPRPDASASLIHALPRPEPSRPANEGERCERSEQRERTQRLSEKSHAAWRYRNSLEELGARRRSIS
jgi:hypothetical protein